MVPRLRSASPVWQGQARQGKRQIVSPTAPSSPSMRAGRLPDLDGALERPRADVDGDVGAGEVGERTLELGGVVEQAGARVLVDVRRALEDLDAQVLATGRAEAQMR